MANKSSYHGSFVNSLSAPFYLLVYLKVHKIIGCHGLLSFQVGPENRNGQENPKVARPPAPRGGLTVSNPWEKFPEMFEFCFLLHVPQPPAQLGGKIKKS